MKKQWVLGIAMAAAPFWVGAADMDKMSKEDMDKMDKPTAVATPVAKAKTAKKKIKKTKKVVMTKGAEMNTGKNESGTAKVSAKKEHWVCPMHDGGESDHAGACPKCGMAMVLEKDDSK